MSPTLPRGNKTDRFQFSVGESRMFTFFLPRFTCALRLARSHRPLLVSPAREEPAPCSRRPLSARDAGTPGPAQRGADQRRAGGRGVQHNKVANRKDHPPCAQQRSAKQKCCTARKNHNKSTIMDCKLFSQSHCRQLLYLPGPCHLWYNRHCTRNIVTHQLQFYFVIFFHNIFC